MPGVVLGNRRAPRAFLLGSLLGAVLFAATCQANLLDELFGPDDSFRSPPSPRLAHGPRRGARAIIGRMRSHVVDSPPDGRLRARPLADHRVFRRIDRRAEAFGPVAGSLPEKPAFCARGDGGALANAPMFRRLLHDKTLRFGDIVVTETGIRVFEGQGACPHAPKDFVTLGAAELSRRRLGALTKLEGGIRAAHARYAHR